MRGLTTTHLLIGLLSIGCTKARSEAAQPAPAGLPGASVDPAIPPEDGQWTMPGKDFQNRRYSGLTEIDTSNVARLHVAWTFQTGIPKGHEAAPLVVGDTMYLVTPFPNRLYALDLSKPGAAEKWEGEPPTTAAAQGVPCCDVVNGGAAFDGGR